MYEKDSTDVPYTAGVSKNVSAEVDEFGTPTFKTFRFVYFVLLSVFAFFGSIYLFSVLLYKRFFRIHFYLFVGHLSVIYFVFGCFILPFYISMFTLEGYWPFGVVLCVIFNIIHNICVYEMQVTVVLIAADRLWAMHWPHHYRVHRNYRNMIATLVLSWIYCGFVVFPTIIHDRVTQTYNDTVCDIAITPNFKYWTSTITLGFLVLSVVALTIYGAIMGIALVRLVKKRSHVHVVPGGAASRGPTGTQAGIDAPTQAMAPGDVTKPSFFGKKLQAETEKLAKDPS